MRTEKFKAYQKEWYQRNKERLLKARKERYLANRDRELARYKAGRAAHSARLKWRYHNEPGYKEKRAVISAASKWRIIPEEIVAFKKLYQEDCFYCGGVGGTIDHLVPRSKGGVDRLYNIVPCCGSCNSSKGSRTPEEWYNA